MSKDKVLSQLRRLYTSNFLSNISIAGAAWVLLLVSDGYSLIQVGLAETVFHIVSLTCEIPSGVFADVFGRKKSLIVSYLCSIMSAAVRGFLPGFGCVLVSIAFSALSYNFASGSDSALAYDSLLEADRADKYDGYISKQTIIYRISNGIATLLAGVAVIMGNRNAQILSIGLSLINLIVLAGLRENAVITGRKKISVMQRVKDTYKGAFGFLRGNLKVAGLIFRNAIVGAIDVLPVHHRPLREVPESGCDEGRHRVVLLLRDGVLLRWVELPADGDGSVARQDYSFRDERHRDAFLQV